MATSEQPENGSKPERMRAIQRLLDDVRAAVSAGRNVNEQSIMAAHAHLMPELGEELKKLNNRQMDENSEYPGDGGGASAETIVRPNRSQSPSETPNRTGEKSVSGNDPGITVSRISGKTADVNRSESSASKADGSIVNGEESKTGSVEFKRPAFQIPGYSVQRELSRGGQAVVFLAIHLSTGRKVALKVMREGPFADERSIVRFQREVQILASLDHPNIVSIIDTGQTADGSHFIAMPYISGVTLDEYMKLRHQKDPDPSKLLRMFYKICVAVNEAHLRGIVHRDLKPANIRVDERSEPHVLDFGLARVALDHFHRDNKQAISITGEFMGSLPWSSPEQADGDPDKIDMRISAFA